jgi:hypothetical protein
MARLTDVITKKTIDTELQHFNNPYSFLALTEEGSHMYFVTVATCKWNNFISGVDTNGVFSFQLNAIDCYVRISKITSHIDEDKSWLELELVKVDNLEVLRVIGEKK